MITGTQSLQPDPSPIADGDGEAKANFLALAPPDADDDETQGYAPNSTWYDTAAERLYICVSASEGAADWKPVPLSTNGHHWSLEFTATNKNHVNCGATHAPATDYGNFYFGIWIKPYAEEYFISTGNGGNHLLLAGVDPSGKLTGNIYDANTSTAYSFVSTEALRFNEWSYVAVIGDTNKVGTAINGIPSYFRSWSGVRRVTDVYECVTYIGGSDHNGYNGLVACWNWYEGSLPYDTPFNVVVRPPLEHFALGQVYDGSTFRNANFIHDYRTRSLMDYGIGHNGAKHNGFLSEGATASHAGFSYAFNFQYYNVNRDATKRPTWVYDPIVYSTTAAAQKTQITSTVIYDDFSRADVHYGKNTVLALGTTRVGSKTWSGAAYGISNGCAFPAAMYGGFAWVTHSSADQTVIVRKPSGWFPDGVGAAIKIGFRKVDATNYNFLYIDEYGSGYFKSVVAGVESTVGSFTFGTNWTDARITATGTTWEAFKDGVSKATATSSANSSGTGAGFESVHPALKVSEFGVI